MNSWLQQEFSALEVTLKEVCTSLSAELQSKRIISGICRFDTVVEQLKSCEADELWVSLGNCDIRDSKIASLTDALSQNSTVTAVDLSRNSITATGAQVRLCTQKPYHVSMSSGMGWRI